LLRLVLVLLSAALICGCCHQRIFGSRDPVHLQLNECRTAVVPAAAFWAGTGVVAEKDEMYSFHVLSPDRWYD
jgi:hypothetical protein